MAKNSATAQPETSDKPRPRKIKLPPTREICPRCGRPSAVIIGRSESHPVIYLRCEECKQTSVAPA